MFKEIFFVPCGNKTIQWSVFTRDSNEIDFTLNSHEFCHTSMDQCFFVVWKWYRCDLMDLFYFIIILLHISKNENKKSKRSLLKKKISVGDVHTWVLGFYISFCFIEHKCVRHRNFLFQQPSYPTEEEEERMKDIHLKPFKIL